MPNTDPVVPIINGTLITINTLLKNKNKVLISEFNNQGLNHSESLLFINPWTIWDKQSKLKYANLKSILKRLKTQFNKSNFLETSIPSELKDKNIYFSYMFDDLFDLYFTQTRCKTLTENPKKISTFNNYFT